MSFQKTIIFEDTEEAKLNILLINGKGVDAEKYIIEKSTGERVLSPQGNEVKLSEFGGLRNGSVIVITNDLPSLIEQSEYIES